MCESVFNGQVKLLILCALVERSEDPWRTFNLQRSDRRREPSSSTIKMEGKAVELRNDPRSYPG